MSEPIVLTPEMEAHLPRIRELLALGFMKVPDKPWMGKRKILQMKYEHQYEMVNIYNYHFADQLRRRRESPGCQPCVVKVYDFFTSLFITGAWVKREPA
jgi:hypothetical protein